jgi:TolA-binding protein
MSTLTCLGAVSHGAKPLSLGDELGVMLRHLGGVQAHVSDVVRQQQQQIEQLQSQLMRLRVQRVLEQTQRLWALSDTGLMTISRSGTGHLEGRGVKSQVSLPTKAWQAAQKIICQTGCVGHAHPWLKADGQCARSGQVCDAQTDQETPRCA